MAIRRSLSVGKAVKLVKIQVQVQHLCPSSLVPKAVQWGRF